MVSRISFDVKIGDREFPGLEVEVRQPFGTDYEGEPIEVGAVKNYKGPWNHAAFSEECERYYRRLVGQSGSAICIPHGTNVRMRNNHIEFTAQTSIEVPNEEGGGWV